MKISEAIKFIVDQNDKKLLTDSKKFTSYLLDLCSDNPKELKIVKRALEDKILERIFGNERDNVKIARLRDEFDEQGMTIDWSEFVISSFAEALGWNYTPKVQNQQSQSQTQQKAKQLQNQSSNQTDWTCSCGTVNNGNFCGNCGKSKPIPKNASWTCFCGTVNKTKFCTNCGKTEQQVKEARRRTEETIRAKEEARRRAEERRRVKEEARRRVQVGDYIKFGRYPQTAKGDILLIEWLVLAKEKNKMLVISKYGLESRRFDSDSNNWQNSKIRKWLNGDFYNNAFSVDDKKSINFSNLSDVGTSDNVFFLSEKEAEKYFTNGEERKCKATDYAVKNGAYVAGNDYSWWWLRSPYPNSNCSALSVNCYGDISIDRVNRDDFYVARPALWINL